MEDIQSVARETTCERGASSAIQTEEIHLRNFDVRRSYDLTIRVRDADGVVFANRYYLSPGETDNEINRIPPGDYRFIIELNSRRRLSTDCEIGPEPQQTALVEIGNGTVSLTEGLYP